MAGLVVVIQVFIRDPSRYVGILTDIGQSVQRSGITISRHGAIPLPKGGLLRRRRPRIAGRVGRIRVGGGALAWRRRRTVRRGLPLGSRALSHWARRRRQLQLGIDRIWLQAR